MEDVVFLINRNLVKMDILEPMVVEVLKRAREFDIHTHEVNNSIFCTCQEMNSRKKGMPQPEGGQKKWGRKEIW